METALKTRIYKGRDGWQAESMSATDANGKAWQISTHKTRGGVVCSAVEGQAGDGTFSYEMFGAKRLNLASATGQCNEKKVREVHEAGLVEFLRTMAIAGADQKPAYVVGIGQVLFTESHCGENRRAVYEIIRPGEYKTVTLDGKKTKHDERVKPYSQKFGIGVYYNEGDIITADEVAALLESATANEQREREAAEQAQTAAAEDRARKLEAGRALVPSIPADAQAVIVACMKVDDSDSQSDYFASHTSERVYLAFSTHQRDLFAEMRKAAANCTIEGVAKYATAPAGDYTNGAHPKDEHREKWSMGAGYYLGDSKYSGWIIEKDRISTDEQGRARLLEELQIAAAEGRYFIQAEAATTAAPVEVPADEVQVIEYSEKALAVVGNTYPIKEQLKAIGGRFNKFLTCGAGWIFPKSKQNELETLLASLAHV